MLDNVGDVASQSTSSSSPFVFLEPRKVDSATLTVYEGPEPGDHFAAVRVAATGEVSVVNGAGRRWRTGRSARRKESRSRSPIKSTGRKAIG